MAIKTSCLFRAKASVNAMFGVKILSSTKIPLAVPPSPNEKLRSYECNINVEIFLPLERGSTVPAAEHPLCEFTFHKLKKISDGDVASISHGVQLLIEV